VAPKKHATDQASTPERRGRGHDAGRTRANILSVAQQVFSEKGLTGARIDEIADLTQTSKRMIYYYFGSKEGLYRAVVEESYRGIRRIEDELDLEHLPPIEALKALVRYTFDYQNSHEAFIRLVMVENIHRAEHLKSLPELVQLNAGAVEHLRDICARGIAEGVFRATAEPLDLHMTISALAFFNVSNRHTMSTIFKLDMTSKAALAHRREAVVDLVVRAVVAPQKLAEATAG
jgi:AcrR family transcriptional regulator